jgi:L,D-transpeptidase ErfK/SrfK
MYVMNSLLYINALIAFLLLTVNAAASGYFVVENLSSDIIGNVSSHIISDNETLIELAREYDVGYNEITAANENIDPWVPGRGTEVILPTSWVLPSVPVNEIIINLAEMRLYYFFSNNETRYVTTYPIGIGRQGFTTPEGSFKITARVKDPVWTVPERVRKELPELPPIVPPGPGNPLGKYWIQLSVNGYGIHGTNRPYGIGRTVSHGCMRLYPEDIERLYSTTQVGTPVRIINEPVKIGTQGNRVYIEVHRSEMNEQELLARAFRKLSEKRLLRYVDTALIMNELKRSTGIPAVISK